MAARLLALAAFFCVCASLRVLPNTLLRSLLAAPSCTALCLEDWELDTGRGMPTQSFAHGIGAWDNDEYLASTKANPPPPPSDYEALKQALAYQAMLVDKGWSEAGVSRGVVEGMIAELEAGLDQAAIAAAVAEAATAAVPKPPRPPPPPPPPPPSLQDPAATLALFGIPPGDVALPAATPIVSSNSHGVASSNSYAMLMAATGGFPAAAIPPPPPPPPVAAVRVAAVRVAPAPAPVPVRVMLTRTPTPTPTLTLTLPRTLTTDPDPTLTPNLNLNPNPNPNPDPNPDPYQVGVMITVRFSHRLNYLAITPPRCA